jgi:hypothetical protein
MKKSKSKEPTTLDIVGDDHDIKERMKIFEAERELGRANDLNKKAKTEGKEEVKEEAKAEH